MSEEQGSQPTQPQEAATAPAEEKKEAEAEKKDETTSQ